MSKGSRHLKLSNSSQDETKQGDQNLTQISLQMSRVSLYQLSNSVFYKGKHLIYSLRGAENEKLIKFKFPPK